MILSDGARSYVYGPEGSPFEQIDSEGRVQYLHHDQQGSIRMITGPSGLKEASTTYTAWGTISGATGSASSPMGYDGQYTNTDTGLIYLRAREYDPATAQFLTRDPLEAATRAPYSFASDEPLANSDPSGRISIELELPELPCIICGTPPNPVEALEEIVKLGEGFGKGVVEGAEIVWHEITGGSDCPGTGDGGEELKRKGEELLGRKHGEAARERWREWWAKLGPGEKKAYNKANGPKPRKGG